MKLLFACVFCLLSYSIRAFEEEFVEELLLKPLYSDQIYAHFHFSTKWNTDIFSESFKHTHLFPRVLGEIIQKHNVQELHLSLTAGLWRYENWGYPITSAAQGAELWVWFRPGTQDVDRNWKELTNSLSGLVCASLNFMDAKNSINPEYSFRPGGVVAEQHINSSLLRYSALPREIVCTENLTPWKKLLPCDFGVGLAALLNSGYIYNTRYHSLAIHLKPVCKDAACTEQAISLQQTLSLVYDYAILGSRNWGLSRFFGQGILGPCPLAKSSTVYVDISSNRSNPFELSPTPDEIITSYRGGSETVYAKYKVPESPFGISAHYLEKPRVILTSPPPLSANQFLTGYGQESGEILTKIYNNHWDTLDVVVLQNIPWYVPIYLHTLKIRCNGAALKPLILKFIPGKLRVQPYHLEIVLRLPSRSTTTISLELDYMFLKWTEYPPDANHGFYIGSAVISSMLPLARNYTGLPQTALIIAESFNASRSGYLVQLRTEVMVITLPTPDFSMPYNVICLACTVVALAFGPLHNITTKRLVIRQKSKEKLTTKLKLFILSKLKRNKDSKEIAKEDTADNDTK